MRSNSAATILRWGLAFVFFYAAIAALLNPGDWILFLPGFLAASPYARIALTMFSLYQLILAGVLFWGKQLYWASLLATITLAGIVVMNVQESSIVFRDVGLAFSSLALFEMSRQNKNHDA